MEDLETSAPFVIHLFSIWLFLTTSTTAHTFCCLSPRARDIGFFFDYAAIALYGRITYCKLDMMCILSDNIPLFVT